MGKSPRPPTVATCKPGRWGARSINSYVELRRDSLVPRPRCYRPSRRRPRRTAWSATTVSTSPSCPWSTRPPLVDLPTARPASPPLCVRTAVRPCVPRITTRGHVGRQAGPCSLSKASASARLPPSPPPRNPRLIWCHSHHRLHSALLLTCFSDATTLYSTTSRPESACCPGRAACRGALAC